MQAWPRRRALLRLEGADTRFTRYRGDGWQMHVALPRPGAPHGARAVARLRAADAGLATRAAIGIGPIDSLGSAASPMRTAPPSRRPATRSTGCRAPDG